MSRATMLRFCYPILTMCLATLPLVSGCSVNMSLLREEAPREPGEGMQASYPCPLFTLPQGTEEPAPTGEVYVVVRFTGEPDKMRTVSVGCDSDPPRGPSRRCLDGYAQIRAVNGHFAEPVEEKSFMTGVTEWRVFFSEGRKSDERPQADIVIGCIHDPTLPPLDPEMPEIFVQPKSEAEI